MLDERVPARDDDAVRLEPGVRVKTVRGIEAHTDCERRVAAIAPQQAGAGDRLRETAGGREYAQCAAHRLFTLGRRHRGGHDRSGPNAIDRAAYRRIRKHANCRSRQRQPAERAESLAAIAAIESKRTRTRSVSEKQEHAPARPASPATNSHNTKVTRASRACPSPFAFTRTGS